MMRIFGRASSSSTWAADCLQNPKVRTAQFQREQMLFLGTIKLTSPIHTVMN